MPPVERVVHPEKIRLWLFPEPGQGRASLPGTVCPIVPASRPISPGTELSNRGRSASFRYASAARSAASAP